MIFFQAIVQFITEISKEYAAAHLAKLDQRIGYYDPIFMQTLRHRVAGAPSKAQFPDQSPTEQEDTVKILFWLSSKTSQVEATLCIT